MKQVLRFSTAWMAVVLSFGNAVVGFTPVAAANVHGNAGASVYTTTLDSGWIQTNWPASNSFFSLYTSQDKVFARIWDSLNGGRMFLTADDGTNWTQIGSADSSIDILSIVMLNSKILVGTWNGFFQSTDDGRTWNAVVPTGIAADTTIWSIVMINSTLFAGITGGIYKSLDDGSTLDRSKFGNTSGCPYCLYCCKWEHHFCRKCQQRCFQNNKRRNKLDCNQFWPY